MPVQKTDRNTQWTLDVPDQEYVLARKATITVSEGYGIYANASGSTITVEGDIARSGLPTAAIRIVGSGNLLEIGDSSEIDFRQREYAIYVEGFSAEIVNRGVVKAGNRAIHSDQSGRLENYGRIDAYTAVYYTNDTSKIVNHGKITGVEGVSVSAGVIHNEKGALISAQAYGIILRSDDSSSIVNKGTISAGIHAIVSENADVEIVNKGKILGDVVLSSKQDHFDTRDGVFRGTVFGGEGNDIYTISRTNTRIDDQGASFEDVVRSSATYTLTGGLDHLELLGKKDIDGTGNSGNNTLYGNNGDNDLKGEFGTDYLLGEEGRDRLSGGQGNDFFFFLNGDDADVIEDFEDGIDKISSSYVKSPQDFDDLQVRDLRGKVVIDFGDGDRLTILGIDADQITYADFVTGAG